MNGLRSEVAPVSRGDLVLGSILFGFYLGYIYFVFIAAVKDTRRARFRPDTFLVMVWIAMASNTCFACLAWTYLYRKVSPSVGLFVGIAVCWMIQAVILNYMTVDRTCILYTEQRSRILYKGVTCLILLAFAVACMVIWPTAQLEISAQFVNLNNWWDRFEKCAFLIINVCLSLVYIRTVKKRLVENGLTKFDNDVRYIEGLILVSMAMDALLLGLTALPKSHRYLYMQFHTIAYIVKLKIEMSMSKFILSVARSTGINVYRDERTTTISRHQRTEGMGENAFQLTKVRVERQVYQERDDIQDDDNLSNPELTKSKDLVIGDDIDKRSASTVTMSTDLPYKMHTG